MCVVDTIDIAFRPLKTTVMLLKIKYFVRKFRHKRKHSKLTVKGPFGLFCRDFCF